MYQTFAQRLLCWTACVPLKIHSGRHSCRYIKVLADKKVSKGWGEVLVQGIFANWLVCIATWQANAAQDMTGKAVAVWLPISAFAMLGFEHCIGELSLQDQLMGLAGNRQGKGQTCNETVADCVLVVCARTG
jgi:formate/nitrite transporter FocA (FNT family)